MLEGVTLGMTISWDPVAAVDLDQQDTPVCVDI
jgi:hypothetical protein